MREMTGLPPEAFEKYDVSPDDLFYRQPRFVAHIDAQAIAAVTELYRSRLRPGGVVLARLSSWVSPMPGHLPDEMAFAAVIGLGMNGDELAANPRLTRHVVQNLNEDPRVPLPTDSVDAALICVSVQYLQRPVSVLRDVRRVLRPGGRCLITFSNRCFPTKAVAIWGALDGAGRKRLVSAYLDRAGFASVEAFDPVPEGGHGDPVHAVIGLNGAQAEAGEA